MNSNIAVLIIIDYDNAIIRLCAIIFDKKSKNNYNSLRLVGKNRRTICADCRKSAEEG